jgi:2-methylcitrate dehydratase PrpD
MGANDVVALRRRIEFYGDNELQRLLPSRQGIVELTMKDGRELRHHTTDVRGTNENPMTRREVDEKAYALMAPVLGEDRARRLCDTVWALEAVTDIRELRPLLQA